jgi:acylphosphatase
MGDLHDGAAGDMMADKVETVRAHLVISGRVQGVWFRGSLRDMARSLRVTGWTRNRPDGKVEAVLEGRRAEVQQLVAWCHHGPRMADVDSVQADWRGATGEFADFRVVF